MASAKPKQTNGAGKKQSKATTPSTGSPTPAASTGATFVQIELTVYGSSKPEKSVYDAEQNKIKAEIDVLQARLVSCASAFPRGGSILI